MFLNAFGLWQSIMVTVLCLGCTSNICGLDSLLVLLFLWDSLENRKYTVLPTFIVGS